MTDKKIREAVEELAAEENLSAEEYLLSLAENANSRKSEKLSAYPDEVRKSISEADRIKSDGRRANREKAEKDAFRSEIAEFMKLFPGVKPESIPETVWAEVEHGVPLTRAYAYYKVIHTDDGDETEVLNRENGRTSLPVEPERAEPLGYTIDDVEKMQTSAVKKNYNKILKSMKKWKY